VKALKADPAVSADNTTTPRRDAKARLRLGDAGDPVFANYAHTVIVVLASHRRQKPIVGLGGGA
jgi:hypothetical protein